MPSRGRVSTFWRACRCWTEPRSEEHTSELQSQSNLVCRLLLEKKKKKNRQHPQVKEKKPKTQPPTHDQSTCSQPAAHLPTKRTRCLRSSVVNTRKTSRVCQAVS